jgi:hypothetical protein
VTVTTEIDITAKAGPVRHQGRRPTCIAFAASDLHASVRTPAYDALSAEYLFYQARQRAPRFDPTRGATLPQIVEAVAMDGQPVEGMWPYLPELPTDLKTYLPPSGITAVFRRSAAILPGTFAALDGKLRAGRAAMIVFEATENFMRAQSDTPVSISPGDKPTGLHAVVAVGLGIANTIRCIRVKNSWGTGWADGGYGWLTEGYFAAHAISVVGMV